MPIDYRYHIGSFVAIFVALLLGILVGIGLAPNPEEFEEQVSRLREEYRETREARLGELRTLEEANKELDMVASEAVAAITRDRLKDLKVAIVLGHDFGNHPIPDNLRALLIKAGAEVTSTTIVTREFVSLPAAVRQQVSQRLSLFPPPGVHFRTIIAEAIAEELAQGKEELILDLHTSGLLRSAANSTYTTRPDAVLVVGGAVGGMEGAPERIDLPLMRRLLERGIRVVGVESREAEPSVMSIYQAAGVPTVDNADTIVGRLAVVLTLAGEEGNYGVKETADSFMPPLTGSSG